MRATDYKVLFALIGTLSWANFIRVSQKKLAAQLGLAPSNVSAAIKRLIRLGLIAKQPDPRDDEKLLLRLSLNLAWRGRPKEWNVAVNAGETWDFAPIPIGGDADAITKPLEAPAAAADGSQDAPADVDAAENVGITDVVEDPDADTCDPQGDIDGARAA